MKERYEAIDSLRMIACIGIMMMHLRANNNYEITGYFYNTVIPSFTNFVFLFMTVSAFGMCCGYYEKVMKQTISLSDFYAKRFKKILPFFGVLVLIDVVLSPSRAALYEAFADLTLLFGFLPNAGNISVIGVGWFLGLVFVFYLCFPFFCVLLANKKRAWISFAVSLLYNFVCAEYFEVGRSNILYSACFFLTGGLIYLYRKELAKLSPYIAVMLAAVSIVAYYLIGGYAMTCLLVSACLLICAVVVRGGVLENRITRFFSNISMEIYLSHMVLFRVIERLGLNTRFGNGWPQYLITVALVLAATVIFAVVMKKVIYVAESKIPALVAAKSK
ncbi:acyltransferase family protein [Herbinix luporum]|uniref:acyltransferase family protein n=1 Tax=Herbinix luporum TaxID=1679721 RepID=UPI00176D73A9|nr:acyltransferase [Herbinix luporum]HHT57144.1 acyltransferase [Herbinix luporum]